MIVLYDVLESYPSNRTRYFNQLGLPSIIERTSKSKGTWGRALSLSLTDTMAYCAAKGKNCFIPSSGLLSIIYQRLISKEDLSDEEANLIREIDDYWHRTSTLIVFPTDETSGYIVHYLKLTDGELRRSKGVLQGRILLGLKQNEVPPYGTVAKFTTFPKFFNKLLGIKDINKFVKQFGKRYDFEPSIWIPPKDCIWTSPERAVIFGGFSHYGQGLWLTAYTKDKTLVGGRPFRVAYDIPES